jgi:hypothetical protein
MKKITFIPILFLIVVLATYAEDGFHRKCANTRICELEKEQGIVKGKRTKQNIMEDIYYKNLNPVRYAYNNALRNNEIKGSYIFVQIDILNTGKVNKTEIIETDFNETEFEKKIIELVNKWKFDKINEKNDTTKLKYLIKLTQ